ncbi:YggS family pyridoxal phosphate-dependent enzyme [Paenibacillus urinalis]|uniref:Pyridoxal phosphate homeostasis protein n=1 Tax=Paenibacillus urinalis TaxID=521520 RepID=A0AAX3MV79_9BACL|nr:YggS family pyridoxal phosphate-dependent enzyme [Paenibacillus urinalis]WDH81516.1 YggS family pyridoxal phosphate-dependent enzyme [Paenibacillus urinalis]WDH97562.1 YggS family pyridoxal phosphate-dependent enzyme [Paenibacillus urinalis]WDI01232.1 YggS family pyridoxal phosphate-dependent enzyme [Paenibacillus urinalis]
MSLEERIQHVDERIQAACEASGRNRESVNVIAVTKYVSAEMTEKVLGSGLVHIGENRWQNAEEKWNTLGHRGIWHFIGHLQTNKVKDVIGKFPYIHSLDRLSLAREIEKKAAQLDIKVQCMLQVNISGEESKYGLQPEQAVPLLREIREFNHIQVAGLMTMAPFEEESERTRPVFRGLRELRDDLNRQALTHEPLTDLSMGMSNDFEIAIQEGATWVRLGSVLVGKEEG